MSLTSASKTETISSAPQQHVTRGLTVRSFIVCLFALFLMGVWVEYEELYNYYGGPLAENAPPNSAVGVIVILLAISGVLYLLYRPLRLKPQEMVVILAALLVAAPLMTQGMWHRFFGLISSIPHNEDFKSYESLPSMLWPHGPNLVDGPFNKQLNGFEFSGNGKQTWVTEPWRGREWACPRLDNGTAPGTQSLLSLVLPVREGKRQLLVPGENFLFSCLVKAEGLQSGSTYFVRLQADDGPEQTMLLFAAQTGKTFALPQGFMRIGKCPVTLPVDLRRTLTLSIGLTGPGQLTVQDVQFFNSQAVEGLYTGVRVVRDSRRNTLGAHEQDFTLHRPDSLFSLRGLGYLGAGFIPLQQWMQPAIAWTLLIGALFLGFLGFNVLMRRQWSENERFTFPMNILPRQLLAEETDAQGRPYLAILRNRVMWIGFGITLLLALLKGIHYYIPGVPAPFNETIQPSTLVANPLMKVFLQNASISISLSMLAIALLVETDILFSIWVSFLLFQLLPVFGKAFNWNRYAGYPWEFQQSIGSFLAYAALAMLAARKHLGRVFRHLTGKQPMDDSGEVVSYRVALLMLIGSLALLVAWGMWTRMGWFVSLIFFGYIMLCGFTASKVRAEAGMPFAYWMPYFSMLFVAAVGGFAVFGSTGMLVAAIASGFMCVSCFFFIAPVQVEMMELGRQFKVRLRDVGSGLMLGLFGGLFIGGFVVLCWAYGFGADNLATSWPYAQNWYFSGFRTGELSADRAFEVSNFNVDAMLSVPATKPLDFVNNVDAKGIGLGALVTGLLALLRSLFMWFPLHPLGYVLATTYFARGFWFIAFVAWLIRHIVLRIGGAHSIRKGLVPFCVGMFLACVASIMIFDVVGFYLRSIGMTNIYSRMP